MAKHHQTHNELWVGFYKKDSRNPSISWPESVDEALCYGWIDGVRKSLDDISYTIRFTPRQTTSIWSLVNIKKVEVLTAEGPYAGGRHLSLCCPEREQIRHLCL